MRLPILAAALLLGLPAAASERLLFVEAGRASVASEAEEAWGLEEPGYLAVGLQWPSWGPVARAAGEVRLVRIGGSDSPLLADVRVDLLEIDALFRPWPRARVRVGFGIGTALFFAHGNEVVPEGERRPSLADVGLGYQVVGEAAIPAGRGRLALRASYQVATDVIDVDYSNLRLGLRAGWAF